MGEAGLNGQLIICGPYCSRDVRFEAARISLTNPTSAFRCLAIASLLSICFSAWARRYDNSRACHISLSWCLKGLGSIAYLLDLLSEILYCVHHCIFPLGQLGDVFRTIEIEVALMWLMRISFESLSRIHVTCHNNIRIIGYIKRITQCPSCKPVECFIHIHLE